MKAINRVGFETRWGYRTFELFHGDLTQLDRNVDILVVSAFARDYYAIPGALIWSLKNNLGIDLTIVAQRPELDLRDPFRCWLSYPFEEQRFRRILCVETPWSGDLVEELRQSIKTLFVLLSILEAQDEVRVCSIALPLLGAGFQVFDPEQAIRPLMEHAQRFLAKSECLREVLFVESNNSRVDALDRAMDNLLGRVNLGGQEHGAISLLRGEMLRVIQLLALDADEPGYEVIEEFRSLCLDERLRSSQWGVIGRRLVERLITAISGISEGGHLSDKIEALAGKGVSRLIRRYMHILRAFGNESVHERDRTGATQPEVGKSDLAICLSCSLRLLEFWASLRRDSHLSA